MTVVLIKLRPWNNITLQEVTLQQKQITQIYFFLFYYCILEMCVIFTVAVDGTSAGGTVCLRVRNCGRRGSKIHQSTRERERKNIDM